MRTLRLSVFALLAMSLLASLAQAQPYLRIQNRWKTDPWAQWTPR